MLTKRHSIKIKSFKLNTIFHVPNGLKVAERNGKFYLDELPWDILPSNSDLRAFAIKFGIEIEKRFVNFNN